MHPHFLAAKYISEKYNGLFSWGFFFIDPADGPLHTMQNNILSHKASDFYDAVKSIEVIWSQDEKNVFFGPSNLHHAWKSQYAKKYFETVVPGNHSQLIDVDHPSSLFVINSYEQWIIPSSLERLNTVDLLKVIEFDDKPSYGLWDWLPQV